MKVMFSSFLQRSLGTVSELQNFHTLRIRLAMWANFGQMDGDNWQRWVVKHYFAVTISYMVSVFLRQLGKEQEFQLGQFFRKRYGNFLSPVFSPNEVFAISSNYERTILSAQLVLAGIFSSDKSHKFGSYIPVHSIPKSFDKVRLWILWWRNGYCWTEFWYRWLIRIRLVLVERNCMKLFWSRTHPF